MVAPFIRAWHTAGVQVLDTDQGAGFCSGHPVCLTPTSFIFAQVSFFLTKMSEEGTAESQTDLGLKGP